MDFDKPAVVQDKSVLERCRGKRLEFGGVLMNNVGYGVPFYNLTQILEEKYGIEVICRPDFSQQFCCVADNDFALPIHQKQYARGYSIDETPVGINFLPLPGAANFHSKHKIIYTVIEADNVNPTWVPLIEKSCDAMFTPSQYNKDVFVGRGVTKPIFIIPHGVSDTFTLKGDKLMMDGPDYYTFLAIFKWRPNKFMDILVEAYCEEFSNDEPVKLLLKAHKEPFIDIQKMVVDIAGSVSPYIEINLDKMTRHRLAMLYRACDCNVSIGMEGFNLPLLESMACGLPAIVLNYGGHLDFAKDGQVITIGGSKSIYKASEGMGLYEGMTYMKPSKKDLRVAMRTAFTQSKLMKAEAQKKADSVRARWNWGGIAESMLLAIDSLGFWK